MAAEGFVNREALKIWKGHASCKGRPHVENKLFTVVLNVGVFMNSEGQKSWRSHDVLFVPTEPTIYTKKSGAVLLLTFRRDKFLRLQQVWLEQI